ncbi:MAG: CCA tRNA nucleotidyltransferase [Methanomassiliicoccales archaeon]
MSVERWVISIISPDEEHRRTVERAISEIKGLVERKAEELGYDIEVRLVGSVAKDTYLPEPDIDLFMMFPPEVPWKELEKEGLEIGREVLNGEEKYAEHPYVHGEHRGFRVDLVPCYRLRDASELKSSVDRTPFHTDFVRARLKDDQKDQVRLLKRFMKGVGVYGAEARTEGFSGYLVELLIMRYGDFRSVIEAATEWEAGESLRLTEGGKVGFDDPLIFYDPVDPNRNVASALSRDSFALFIQACKEYLEREDERFFFPRERMAFDIDTIRGEIEERGTSIMIVKFPRPGITDDNLYPQVRKTMQGLISLLRNNDFEVLDSAYHVDEGVSFVFELESEALPRCRRHQGPPVWISHSERFLEKWRGGALRSPFIENGRWVVMAERECHRATDLVTEKVDSTSMGSELRGMECGALSTSESLVQGNESILSSLMDKRFNWEV